MDLLSARLVAFWEGSILLAKLRQDCGLYRDLIGGAMALLAPHRAVQPASGAPGPAVHPQ